MTKYTLHDVYEMDSRYRSNLINGISGIKSANLIGTTNTDGQTNLAVFNSVMHIGANPPLLSIIVRPHSVDRHTYENIKSTGYFTVNAITIDLVERAHQTSGKYPEGISEFIVCQIKPSYSDLQPAPFVAESPIQIGLKIEEEHHIRSNNTIMLVGRIVEINLVDGGLKKDGHLDLVKLNLTGVNGLDSYCQASSWRIMPYVSKESIQ